MRNLLIANLLFAPIVILLMSDNFMLLLLMCLYILCLCKSKRVRKTFILAYKEEEVLTKKIMKL